MQGDLKERKGVPAHRREYNAIVLTRPIGSDDSKVPKGLLAVLDTLHTRGDVNDSEMEIHLR